MKVHVEDARQNEERNEERNRKLDNNFSREQECLLAVEGGTQNMQTSIIGLK